MQKRKTVGGSDHNQQSISGINCPTEEGVGFREFRVYLGADLRIYKLWAFRIEFLGLAGAEA